MNQPLEPEPPAAAGPATSAANRDHQLELALRAGGFGTWVWNAATGVMIWDEQMERLFGLAPGSFDGTFDAWLALLPPDERDAVLATVQDALSRRGTYELRHRVLWTDGSVHWLEGLGQVTVDAAGESTGTLGCARDVSHHVLAEERLARVAAAAAVSAVRAEQLQAVTADLSRALTIGEVAKAIEGHADGLLGASGGAVALIKDGTRMIGVPAFFGYDPSIVAAFDAVPLEAATPMTECLRRSEPIVLTAEQLTQRYPHLASASAEGGHDLVAAFPLQAPGRDLGALLLSFSDRQRFEGEELAFVTAVAAQCSQAIERARLLGRLSEVAVTLQHGLAPHDLPAVEGIELAAVYEPGGDEMEHLGGDWYDVVLLEESKAAVVIGDVMGRGVLASTTMTRVRTAVRAYALVDPTPAAVMTKLDRFLVREAPENFVTLIYGIVDAGAGTVELINAGHLPPMLVRADGTARRITEGASVPLGLARLSRVAARVDLAEADALLLYTDGLVERRDRDIDTGLDALAAATTRSYGATPLQEMLNTIVVTTTAGEPSGDDVTALMLRRVP